MTGKQAFIFIFCSLVLLMYHGCKKGCTDKNALNYLRGAKEDDGDCLYCDSSYQTIQYQPMGIQDDSFGSPFEGLNVLVIYIESTGELYSGNGCQKYNIPPAGSCITISHNCGLTNLLNQAVVFSGSIVVAYTNGQQFNYTFNSLQVAPNAKINLGNIGNLCVPAADTGFSWSFPNGYSIHYK